MGFPYSIPFYYSNEERHFYSNRVMDQGAYRERGFEWEERVDEYVQREHFSPVQYPERFEPVPTSAQPYPHDDPYWYERYRDYQAYSGWRVPYREERVNFYPQRIYREREGWERSPPSEEVERFGKRARRGEESEWRSERRVNESGRRVFNNEYRSQEPTRKGIALQPSFFKKHETVETFNSYIQLYVNLNDPHKVRENFDAMIKEGIKPNIKTFTIWLSLCINREDVQEAKAVLREMEKSGCEPNEVICNTLFQLYLKKECIEEAQSVLDKIEKGGMKAEEKNRNTLFLLYVKKEEVKKAEAVLEKMEKGGMNADRGSIKLLIHHYVNKKEWTMAEKYFALIANRYPIKQEEGQDVLDCQGLSHGAACVMIRIYLKKKKNKLSFRIIPESGTTPTKDAKMTKKAYVQKFLRKHYPKLVIQELEGKPGRFKIKFPS